MSFKARKLKGGFFEIIGLEKFLREKLGTTVAVSTDETIEDAVTIGETPATTDEPGAIESRATTTAPGTSGTPGLASTPAETSPT